jgi:hypothetical protein
LSLNCNILWLNIPFCASKNFNRACKHTSCKVVFKEFTLFFFKFQNYHGSMICYVFCQNSAVISNITWLCLVFGPIYWLYKRSITHILIDHLDNSMRDLKNLQINLTDCALHDSVK